MDMTIIRSLIEAVRESFEDADTEREYERWMRERDKQEEQQDAGEQV